MSGVFNDAISLFCLLRAAYNFLSPRTTHYVETVTQAEEEESRRRIGKKKKNVMTL
jgi:hypothetical protein